MLNCFFLALLSPPTFSIKTLVMASDILPINGSKQKKKILLFIIRSLTHEMFILLLQNYCDNYPISQWTEKASVNYYDNLSTD